MVQKPTAELELASTTYDLELKGVLLISLTLES